MSIVSAAVAAPTERQAPVFKAGQRVIVPTRKNRCVGLVQGMGLDPAFVKVPKRVRSYWLRADSLTLAD